MWPQGEESPVGVWGARPQAEPRRGSEAKWRRNSYRFDLKA